MKQQAISINVDLTNPGQYFACCGLLELADRLRPGAEGWFDEAEHRFVINCETPLIQILTALAHCTATRREKHGSLDVKPIIAPLELNFAPFIAKPIVLDAWVEAKVIKGEPSVVGNSPWNFWSGNQTSLKIWNGLQTSLRNQLPRLPNDASTLFEWRIFQDGRFGFDPGPAWNAIDVGFSPNEHKMQVSSAPVIEMLAAIGATRFKPALAHNRQSIEYSTWHFPCAPNVAFAFVSQDGLTTTSTKHRADVITRGQYAALGYSNKVKGQRW